MFAARLLAGFIASVLFFWTFPALALDPLKGPEYDKEMIIDLNEPVLGLTVGMFAACAQERVVGFVRQGVRTASQRVRGEEEGEFFVVTVPGVNTDIKFFFEKLGDDSAGQLFLSRMSIGEIIASKTEDKFGAISALIPNCL